MTSKPTPIQQHIPLGHPPWKTFEPFLFCVHHHDQYPAGDEQQAPRASLAGRNIGSDFSGLNGWSMYHGDQVPGFPQHPHRGFETISIVRRGLIDHSDSLGATARIGEGDVQWMTAGAGIVHAEMFPLVHQDQKNPTDFFQLWLNLPAARKMVPPAFKMFWSEEVPRIRLKDLHQNESVITVIAGKYKDTQALPPPEASWAAVEGTEVAIWLIDLAPQAQVDLPAQPEHTRRVIYHVNGGVVKIGDELLSPKHAALMNPQVMQSIVASPSSSSRADTTSLLVLQAQPINEPVVQHGPFVMNSSYEIREAFYDYQRTGFGGWPWRSADPVHPRDKGRFAQFSDGSISTPPKTLPTFPE